MTQLLSNPFSLTNISISGLLHSVLDEMLEGFQVIDEDWRYLYVNETVAKHGHRKKEELIGKTMMECYPEIAETPMFKQLERSKNERVSIRMENEFLFPDGTKGWFQLYIHPWDNGVLVFSADITERKNAQEELFQKINELHTLMESAIDREMQMTELKQTIDKLKGMVPSKEPVIVARK